MKKLAVLTAVVGCLAGAPAALAASSPTVTPRPATGITASGAVLNGTVDPNGATTVYHFDYGPTPALGAVTASVAIGHGTAAVAVKAGLSDLTSGTVYYYELLATSAVGTTVSRVESFRSGGNPPPIPTTGGALSISPTGMTLTGLVATDGQPTTYYFQYGLAPTYGLQTAPVTIAAADAPVTVEAGLGGLTPGTVFHYRLVATHGSTPDTGFGADGMVETYPSPAPVGTIHARTLPRTIRARPFVFSTSGLIVNPTPLVASDATACNTALVPIEFFVGHTVIATNEATVGSDCRFAAVTTIGRLPHIRHITRNGPVRIRVKLEFLGSPWLAPSKRFSVVVVR